MKLGIFLVSHDPTVPVSRLTWHYVVLDKKSNFWICFPELFPFQIVTPSSNNYTLGLDPHCEPKEDVRSTQ